MGEVKLVAMERPRVTTGQRKSTLEQLGRSQTQVTSKITVKLPQEQQSTASNSSAVGKQAGGIKSGKADWEDFTAKGLENPRLLRRQQTADTVTVGSAASKGGGLQKVTSSTSPTTPPGWVNCD